jgi:hypothetical protein
MKSRCDSTLSTTRISEWNSEVIQAMDKLVFFFLDTEFDEKIICIYHNFYENGSKCL